MLCPIVNVDSLLGSNQKKKLSSFRKRCTSLPEPKAEPLLSSARTATIAVIRNTARHRGIANDQFPLTATRARMLQEKLPYLAHIGCPTALSSARRSALERFDAAVVTRRRAKALVFLSAFRTDWRFGTTQFRQDAMVLAFDFNLLSACFAKLITLPISGKLGR